jgi:hypothetical protein
VLLPLAGQFARLEISDFNRGSDLIDKLDHRGSQLKPDQDSPITTTRLCQFFQEVGSPGGGHTSTSDGRGSCAFLANYATVSAKYGYWSTTLEENAAVETRF